MKDIIRRIEALEAVMKKHGACFTVHLVNGKTKRVTASEAVQIVRDAQAKSIEADEAVQYFNECGAMLYLLADLIEG